MPVMTLISHWMPLSLSLSLSLSPLPPFLSLSLRSYSHRSSHCNDHTRCRHARQLNRHLHHYLQSSSEWLQQRRHRCVGNRTTLFCCHTIHVRPAFLSL